MTYDLITNAGVENFRQQLERQLKTCKSFSIATAFITKEACELLKTFISKNRTGLRNGRLIISVYQCFNKKEVLQELYDLVETSGGKLQVAISNNVQFHWKYYYFESKIKTTAYIGSANFTKSGISEAGELVSKVTLSRTEKGLRQNLLGVFDKEWEASTSIAHFPINKYKSSSSLIKGAIQKLHPDIIQLLKSKDTEDVEDERLPELATKIFGFLTARTMKMVSLTQSHWDKNNWEYFVCYLKRDYERLASAKTFFIIEQSSNKYFFNIGQIKSSCILNTPDGKYFIAYTPITRSKRENEVIRRSLKDVGFDYRSSHFIHKKLSPKQKQAFYSLFQNNK
jgi:HKD family nuclease